ncbi:MAG TPA: molybdate ABC transporter substrate-binding protein [Candidatus Eisenbacteria bacterium]|nr:molybdate ABC transporter substrate-binding protein [Candidatus Eisenbacteria bacterium]
MAKSAWGLPLILLLATVGTTVAGAQQITVAAAADLNYALTELANRFEHDTGSKVTLSFGSSGNLYSQIVTGAPFDLFFSADEAYPQRLVADGVAEAKSLRTYAFGHLVLWVPNRSSLDLEKLQMQTLTHPSVTRIAIANPQYAPYGRAAMAAIDHYGLKERVAGKLVFGESVSQAAQFVQSGNAQAGLIALSLAKSPAMAETGRYWEVPADAYPGLRQAAVILAASKQKKTAAAFLDFVVSAEGATVLQQFGLTPPMHP